MTTAIAKPNKRKSWRAFTRNHPLWNAILEMRQSFSSWATITTYAAQRGHRLTADQIEYGFKQAGVDYPRRVTPWVNTALMEWHDKTLPAVEDMMAALTKEAQEIQLIEDARTDLRTTYNQTEEPAARAVLLDGIMGLSRSIFNLVSSYLHDLVLFRNAVGDAFPTDMAGRILGETGTAAIVTSTKALAITDSRVIYREMKRLHYIMRHQMEIMVEAAKRGENIPEFAPLGPENEQGVEGVIEDASWSLTDDIGGADDE